MTDGDQALEKIRRRLERERSARREAEAIAERVTRELYASAQELERVNAELHRTNDDLQKANQTMRDFVAVASHDLRAPLTSVIGYTSLMVHQWGNLTEEQKIDFLSRIRGQGEHLNRLVEDLLTVSKIEAEALDVHREVILLREALSQAIGDFAERAAAIRVSAPPELAVVADPEHLRRILENFLTNALKYGAPPVEVEAQETGESVEIRVRDSGDGVPEDFIPRLFGRFARADTPATRANGGTGLGLSIVQGLAQANGGDTWYEPNSPSGACFALRLPKSAA